MLDHYQTLGINRTASPEEIKRAYRRLASQHHPDKGGDTQRFQAIQQAYDVLSDPAQRQVYDNPQTEFQFGPGVNFGFNFDEVFQMFNQQRGSQHRVMRISVWVSLEDIATGGQRIISLATSTGAHNVEIDIPMAINDGDAVRYLQIGPNREDLVIQYRIRPHPAWTRQNLDLTATVPVSIWTLIEGGNVEVRDIRGQCLELTVPRDSKPDTVLRLRHKGLDDGKGSKGDMYARLTAHIPYPVPDDLRALIRQTVGK